MKREHTLAVVLSGLISLSAGASDSPVPSVVYTNRHAKVESSDFSESQMRWLSKQLTIQTNALNQAQVELQKALAEKPRNPEHLLERRRQVVMLKITCDGIVRRIKETEETGR